MTTQLGNEFPKFINGSVGIPDVRTLLYHFVSFPRLCRL